MSVSKIITAIAALITAIGGLLIAINTMFDDGDVAPQPITHIIIQEIGDYADFLEETNLEEYQDLK